MWLFGVCLSIALSLGGFTDVPEDHWAYAAVASVSARGYMSGYPDGTFQGERPITRFEFAVALDRFVRDVEKGLKEAPKSPNAGDKNVGVAPTHWAHGSLLHLLEAGYLPPSSPIFSEKTKHLTPKQLGEALGKIAAHIAYLHSSPPED